MKAIILAAGYATRLYPITEKFSKALLPINDKPIINYIVENLYKIDKIEDIFVITNDLFYNDFLNWKAEYKFEKVTVVNDNTNSDKNKLGAIGDIKYVIDNQGINDETLIVAGDSFFDFELSAFVEEYEKTKTSIACVRQETEKDLTRFGIAEIENGKILNIEEKPQHPKSNTVVYACYIYNKEDMNMIGEYLATGNSPDAPGHYIAWLCKRRAVNAFIVNGYYLDIGTHESYNAAQHI